MTVGGVPRLYGIWDADNERLSGVIVPVEGRVLPATNPNLRPEEEPVFSRHGLRPEVHGFILVAFTAHVEVAP